jgi:hypothetical protein
MWNIVDLENYESKRAVEFCCRISKQPQNQWQKKMQLQCW